MASNMDGQDGQDNREVGVSSALRKLTEQGAALVVEKDKIAASGEYNLSGERYRERVRINTEWPLVRLGDLVKAKSGNSKIIKGRLPKQNDGNLFPAYSATGQDVFSSDYDYEGVGIIISAVGARCGKCFLATGRWQAIANTHVLIPYKEKVIPKYLFKLINKEDFWVKGGVAQPFVKVKDSLEIEIPLPPLEIQREIVAEIEGYQRVIDGARAVIDNYRPHIAVDPDWPLVELGDVCSVKRGASPRPIRAFTTDSSEGVNWIKIGDASIGSKYITSTKERITAAGAAKSRRVKPGDFILSNSMSYGRPYVVDIDGCIHDGWLLLRLYSDRIEQDFLYHILGSKFVSVQFKRAATGGVVNNLNSKIVRAVIIPIPSLQTQQSIVAEIETEYTIIAANRRLVEQFEKKIQDAIGRVWGEGK